MHKIFSRKWILLFMCVFLALGFASCNLFGSDDDDDDSSSSSNTTTGSSESVTGSYTIDGETYVVSDGSVTNASGESVGSVNSGTVNISFESGGATITITIKSDGSIEYKITTNGTSTTYTGSVESGTLTNTEDASDTISASKSDYTIVTDFASGTTVWTGNQVFSCDENCNNWTGSVTLRFHGVSAGDQILITHEANESYTNWGYKTLKIAGYDKWDDLHLALDGKLINCSIGGTATDTTLPLYTATQTTGIVLSEKDAEIINTYHGITLWGIGVTIKKIVVVSNGVTGIASRVAKNGWGVRIKLYNLSSFSHIKVELVNEAAAIDWSNNSNNISEDCIVRFASHYTPISNTVTVSNLYQKHLTEGTSSDYHYTFTNTDGSLFYVKETLEYLGELAATYSADDMTITFTSLPSKLLQYIELNKAYAIDSISDE